MKRLTFLILISSICLYVLGIKPERKYFATPENYGMIYKELQVTTIDGISIKTWFFPVQDTITKEEIKKLWKNPTKKEYKTIDKQPKPTIIICNGDAGNMAYLIQFARELVLKNFNIVIFDWRGFGHSDDWEMNPDYFCYAEFLLDYDAVLDETLKQPEVDKNRIGVFGYSTGAYLSFAIATQRNEIKAFAGRGLMTCFKDVKPLLNKIMPGRDLLIPEDYPQNLIPINASINFSKPAFLIVGEKDDRTPVWMTKKIYNNLKGEKELWIVENAEHGGANGPEFINFKRFNNRLAKFFSKHL